MISKEQFLLIGGRISFASATDFLVSHPSIPVALRNKYFNELQNVEPQVLIAGKQLSFLGDIPRGDTERSMRHVRSQPPERHHLVKGGAKF